METTKVPTLKLTDIVGNYVKADQAQVREDPFNPRRSGEDADIVTLNVGGVKHETKIATLLKRPETRLYSVGETAKASGRREFYFDRNPQIFPCILNYYRIGKLHMPTDICGPAAKAELDYWELEDKDIEECCWVNYISYEETMEMLEKFEADERNKLKPVYVPPEASCFLRYKPRIWRALQDPYSSRPALYAAIFSLVMVLISIIVFVIETLPFFNSVYVHASDSSRNITSDHLRKEMGIFSDITPNDVLLLIDNTCNVFFFAEFIIKLATTPDRKKFFKSPLVILEMMCIIPYYIAICIVFFHPEPIDVFLFIRVLFATRVLRIFRIFILMKHFLALKILIFTIRASTRELFLLLIVLLIGVVTFACLVYYMEIFSDGVDTDFKHIPLAFWWALITMTTVGYGDVVPRTALGYMIGGFCGISGVLVIALSVPVIVNNFTVYYTHAQSREKLKLRKKKFEQTEKWQRLKVGLKSRIKNGTLNGLLTAARKKPAAADTAKLAPAPKTRFGITGGGASATHTVIELSSVGETDDTALPIVDIETPKVVSQPATARDVILEANDVTQAETSLNQDGASTSSKGAISSSSQTSDGSRKKLVKQGHTRSKLFSKLRKGSPKIGIKPNQRTLSKPIANGGVGFGRKTDRFKSFPVT